MPEKLINNDLMETAKSAWNEAAVVHKQYRFNQLLEGFKRPGFVSMPELRLKLLKKHGVSGKSVIQPCCNNGRDILSIKNLGAGFCMGFDISNEFINQGMAFAKAGNIDCELIVANVYSLDNKYAAKFDIGVISLGTLMWMPSLESFFTVMKDVLVKDGWLLIHELHPLAEIIKFNQNHKRAMISGSYFDDTPHKWEKGLDYYSGKPYDATPCYSFRHKISDIISALVENGFTIESFREYEADMSSGAIKRAQPRNFPVPRSYTLTAFNTGKNI